MSKTVTIVGGHGRVGLRLAKLLKSTAKVISIIRDPVQAEDIQAVSATPLVLSLEDTPVEQFTAAFDGSDIVVFSAGAAGKPGPNGQTKQERARLVDGEGAIKVFDAIEGVQGKKPRLLLVSAQDIRDRHIIPEWYNENDLKISEHAWTDGLPQYMNAKYLADKDLTQRTAFEWTIIRPGPLTDSSPAGTTNIGRIHISERPISRDDVAKVIALLIDRPDAHGLVFDVLGGETPLEEALDSVIKNRVTSWVG